MGDVALVYICWTIVAIELVSVMMVMMMVVIMMMRKKIVMMMMMMMMMMMTMMMMMRNEYSLGERSCRYEIDLFTMLGARCNS